ncbi:hypothetical protein EDB81DRAFT_767306 [Dactylonectria macrodidyma]|uniref:Uncharacterized protein n=1 Tax=Dactylonectria macrodidyma TaxID=307937 RepID=A0A9P9DE83_9HYPO|nr:hypothetical protein EDB81DRAFT_767306 [Dactylonectria macrodidyma]
MQSQFRPILPREGQQEDDGEKRSAGQRDAGESLSNLSRLFERASGKGTGNGRRRQGGRSMNTSRRRSVANSGVLFRPIRPRGRACQEVDEGRGTDAKDAGGRVAAGLGRLDECNRQNLAQAGFDRHLLPKERRDGGAERLGMSALGGPPPLHRNKPPTVRIIQPKQSVSEEDIRRCELAAAITRGLPKRYRGRGRRPKARPNISHVSDAAGLAQHALLAQARDGDVRVNVDDAAAEPEDAALVRKTLFPKVASGALGAAVVEPMPLHRHILPKENRRGDEEEDGMAAVAQRECEREGSSVSRMRPQIEGVRRHALQPLLPEGTDATTSDGLWESRPSMERRGRGSEAAAAARKENPQQQWR